MYKVVKLRKSDLKLEATDFLRKMGVVKGKLAHPGKVHVNEVTYNALLRTQHNLFKKEYPNLKKRALTAAIAMHMFNYGPSTKLGVALKPGYALVDTTV